MMTSRENDLYKPCIASWMGNSVFNQLFHCGLIQDNYIISPDPYKDSGCFS